MSTFACRTRDGGGSVIELQIEAATRREALQMLERDGLVPVRVQEVKSSKAVKSTPLSPHVAAAIDVPKAAPSKSNIRGRVTRKELMQFSLQLSGSLGAGVPILNSLKSVRTLTKNKAFKSILSEICVDLENGMALSDAMEKHPRVFPSVYTGTIAAGEKSGTLDDMLDNLAEYLEADMEIRSDLKSAIMYPAIVVVALCLAIVALMVFVVPRFATFYSGFGSELPLATRLLIDGSEAIQTHWMFVLGGIIGAIFGMRAMMRRPAVRAKADRMILKIPVVGKLVDTAITLQVIQILGLFTQAGVPILEALQTAARTTSNSKYCSNLVQVSTEVAVGETVASGLEKVQCFPQEARQMLANGEATGTLEQACTGVVRRYKKELRYQTKQVATLIEPMLTLVLAVIVLFVALAVFLPMWDMVKVVGK